MPAKFTFSAPSMKAWLLIHQSHNLLKKLETAVMAQTGLTARQHSILLALKNLKSPVTITNIAHWLDRNSNAISMLVDGMEREGLVSRLRNMPDRREVRLVITDRGEQQFKSANTLTGELFQSIFSGIPDENLQKLADTLEQIRFKSLDMLELKLSHEKLHVLDKQPDDLSGVINLSVIGKAGPADADDEDNQDA